MIVVAIVVVVLFPPLPILALLSPLAAFVVAMLAMRFCLPGGVVDSLRGTVGAIYICSSMFSATGQKGNHHGSAK
jgi:hypothetical protein